LYNSVGESLEQTTDHLPPSSKLIALIYNVRAEGSTTSKPPATKDPRIPLTITPGNGNGEESLDIPNDLYAEWDTIETVNAVKAALEERHRVVLIEANESAYQKLLEFRPDFAFNIAEGLYGVSRESQIPAILEMLQIPYSGSDPLTLAVCLDKSRTKEILSYHGIPTPNFAVIRSPHELEDIRVRYPAMVKPLHEGSSKGIFDSCIAHTKEELKREIMRIASRYSEPALVEDFLPGREFTVAILGNGGSVRVLPIVEIRFDSLPAGVNHIYSYEAKWVWDRADHPLDIFQCPAKLHSTLKAKIEHICKESYRILNCRDWARIDVRLDRNGNPQVIELNPLPGILPNPQDNSCYPKAARAAGIQYNELINTVLDIAMARYEGFGHEMVYPRTSSPQVVESA
jgi:D-alanine-D-alanine ligase